MKYQTPLEIITHCVSSLCTYQASPSLSTPSHNNSCQRIFFVVFEMSILILPCKSNMKQPNKSNQSKQEKYCSIDRIGTRVWRHISWQWAFTILSIHSWRVVGTVESLDWAFEGGFKLKDFGFVALHWRFFLPPKTLILIWIFA